MHEAKSVNTQSIKNLRRTFFNNGPYNVKVKSKLNTFHIYGPFVQKGRFRFLINGILAEIWNKT